MNSHRSISPTPRSTLAKPLFPDSRRHTTLQERAVLQSMQVDERDIELLREFMEKHAGSLKRVEEESGRVRNQVKKCYMNGGGQGSGQQSGAKAHEIHQRKLLRNDIRELERKLLEMDSKNEAMEDELSFQNQILSKVIAQLPGVYQRETGGELEALVGEHEEVRRQEMFQASYSEYEKKKLEGYTIEDFQSLFAHFPKLIQSYKDEYRALKLKEQGISEENEAISKRTSAVNSAVMLKEMENRAKAKQSQK
ncbi:hypothetical protein FGO68_gene1908 [Halteria grandinella]|uniref:Uncharacterized protein n=1 Tax=Halteria grandinella TaxID=5974 RepID=A0A8J8P3V0_HALGN|nr:hypothetical protein FGO68_gene1908 [Halteria grandinella]